MILAKCIKEAYTWEGDHKQHQFSKVVEGHVYGFNKIENIYWIDPEVCSTEDFKDANGFIDGVARGLKKEYFDEMFEII
jgi:hypothetical protein